MKGTKRRNLVCFIIFVIAVDLLLTFLFASYSFKAENYAAMADVYDCISCGHFPTQEEMERYQLGGVSDYTVHYSLKSETLDVHIYGKGREHVQYIFTKDFEKVSFKNFEKLTLFIIIINATPISLVITIIIADLISNYKTSKKEKAQ